MRMRSAPLLPMGPLVGYCKHSSTYALPRWSKSMAMGLTTSGSLAKHLTSKPGGTVMRAAHSRPLGKTSLGGSAASTVETTGKRQTLKTTARCNGWFIKGPYVEVDGIASFRTCYDT